MVSKLSAVVTAGIASVAITGTTFAVATADSNTWEGAYEANDTPDNALGFGNFGAGAYSSVSGGILRINSIGADSVAVYEKWPANPLSPAVDFTNGATLEFRVKLNQSEGPGSAMFTFFDANDQGALIEINTNEINFPSTGWVAVPTTDAFHIYRITFNTTGGTAVNLYYDNNPVAALSLSSLPFSNQGRGPNAMLIGDGANAADADWEIDYVRWTDAGAFAPVPVPEPSAISLLCLAGGLVLRRRR